MAYPFSNFSPWGNAGGVNFGQPPTPQFGLANQTNTFMQQQARLPYAFNLPNYGALIGQRSRNVGNMLAGQVPQDVIDQLQQRTNENAAGRGFTGGPATNASWLRALGLTSLGLQQQGSQQLSQSIQDTPVGEIWNPLALYVPQLQQREELAAAQMGRGGQQGYSPSRWRFSDPSGALI